jgi:type II secretory pathway component GspD/PulD (secretin)
MQRPGSDGSPLKVLGEALQTPLSELAPEVGPAPGVLEAPPADQTLPAPAGRGAGTPPRAGVMRVPIRPQADPNQVTIAADAGLVTLVVRDGSLRRVVSLLAETQRLNVVFSGAADVPVTASFDRAPWMTILDALLGATGHTWHMADNVLFVAPVAQADELPAGADARVVEVFELDFAAAADVAEAVAGMLSPAGKSWIMESAIDNNRRTREAVAVVDYPRHLERIRQLVCQLDQPPRQVLIEAHILSIDLSDECRNGVNFQNLMRLPSANVTLESVGLANADSSPSFFVDVDGVGLDGLVELLQSTTDAKTLASPRIHAVSGQSARIQIGEQLGFRITTTTQTSTLESVQFLDVGIVLEVTPRITRDGRVMMRIWPKVSSGEVNVVTGLPSEETTEVETDVLLSSGQGLVIGGLIQEQNSVNVNKIPWLGDIPYAGVLFQNRRQVKSRSEIVVTLRPHVLPYSPNLQARNDELVRRTETPLTYGPLCEFPRPEEPQLPDALKGRRPVPCDTAIPCAPAPSYFDPEQDMPLVRLPEVDPRELSPASPIYEAGRPTGMRR